MDLLKLPSKHVDTGRPTLLFTKLVHHATRLHQINVVMLAGEKQMLYIVTVECMHCEAI